MRRILVPGLLFVVSCSLLVAWLLTRPQPTGPNIDPAVKEFVDRWKSELKQEGLDPERPLLKVTRIEFAKLNDEFAGVSCPRAGRVWINSRQKRAGYYRTLCTVYHELGHSLFGLEHGSCEIMQERCPTEEYLRQNWVQLSKEYINQCKGVYSVVK